MRRKLIFIDRKKLYLVLGIVLIFVLSLSMVYAALSVTLNIVGQAEVNSSWGIKFLNPKVTEGSVTTKIPVISNNTTATFSTQLNTPGDFYEFEIEVYNYGNIDAIIEGVSKPLDLSDEQKKYLRYDISWKNDIAVDVKQYLAKGSRMYLVVRVEYRNDISGDDLPSQSSDITLSFKLDYVQSNSNLFDSEGNFNGQEVDSNTQIIAFSNVYNVVPGVSLFQGIKEGKLVSGSSTMLPYEYSVYNGDSSEYFLDKNYRVANLNTTFIQQGETYDSYDINSTVSALNSSLGVYNNNTIMIDSQPVYSNLGYEYTEPIYTPVFSLPGDTLLDVCHAAHPLAGPYEPVKQTVDMEQDILLGIILGYASGQSVGCNGTTTTHDFFAFIDENDNFISLDTPVYHGFAARMVMMSISGEEMTFDEAKETVIEYVGSLG